LEQAGEGECAAISEKRFVDIKIQTVFGLCCQPERLWPQRSQEKQS
jgi:hypothetical protein